MGGFATFSWRLDNGFSDTGSAQIGVALWSKESRWAGTLWIRPSDEILGVDKVDYPYIWLVKQKIECWLNNEPKAYEDEWWSKISDMLNQRVLLSKPKAIDCKNPKDEIKGLFDSVVGPILVKPPKYESKPPYLTLWEMDFHGIRVVVPDSNEFMYYDGWFLAYFDSRATIEDDSSERGLSHDAAFAAAASAAWRRRCSRPRECQCQCTCTQCVLAHAWQRAYEKIMSKMEAE